MLRIIFFIFEVKIYTKHNVFLSLNYIDTFFDKDTWHFTLYLFISHLTFEGLCNVYIQSNCTLHLDFADDIAEISSNRQHLQEKTTILNRYAEKTGLKINQSNDS